MAQSRSKRRRSRSNRQDEPRHRGSLSSLRTGFRNLAGGGRSRADARGAGNRFIPILLIIAAAILIIFMLARG
jgi:hypothetical protein